jgi:hypothetical protein
MYSKEEEATVCMYTFCKEENDNERTHRLNT